MGSGYKNRCKQGESKGEKGKPHIPPKKISKKFWAMPGSPASIKDFIVVLICTSLHKCKCLLDPNLLPTSILSPPRPIEMPAKVFLEQKMYLNPVCQKNSNILKVKKYCFKHFDLKALFSFQNCFQLVLRNTLTSQKFYRQKLSAQSVLYQSHFSFPKKLPDR